MKKLLSVLLSLALMLGVCVPALASAADPSQQLGTFAFEPQSGTTTMLGIDKIGILVARDDLIAMQGTLTIGSANGASYAVDLGEAGNWTISDLSDADKAALSWTSGKRVSIKLPQELAPGAYGCELSEGAFVCEKLTVPSAAITSADAHFQVEEYGMTTLESTLNADRQSCIPGEYLKGQVIFDPKMMTPVLQNDTPNVAALDISMLPKDGTFTYTITGAGSFKLTLYIQNIASGQYKELVISGMSVGAIASNASSEGVRLVRFTDAAPVKDTTRTDNIPNPFVEYADLDELNAELDMDIALPDDVHVNYVAAISGTVADIDFTRKELNYCLRAQKSDAPIENLAGQFEASWSDETVVNYGGRELNVHYLSGTCGYVDWYDADCAVQYSLSMGEDVNTISMLTALTEILDAHELLAPAAEPVAEADAITEYASLDELCDASGIEMFLPEKVKDVSYKLVNGVATVDFTLGKHVYSYRAINSEAYVDLTGIDKELYYTDTESATNIDASGRVIDSFCAPGSCASAEYYDSEAGIQYAIVLGEDAAGTEVGERLLSLLISKIMPVVVMAPGPVVFNTEWDNGQSPSQPWADADFDDLSQVIGTLGFEPYSTQFIEDWDGVFYIDSPRNDINGISGTFTVVDTDTGETVLTAQLDETNSSIEMLDDYYTSLYEWDYGTCISIFPQVELVPGNYEVTLSEGAISAVQLTQSSAAICDGEWTFTLSEGPSHRGATHDKEHHDAGKAHDSECQVCHYIDGHAEDCPLYESNSGATVNLTEEIGYMVLWPNRFEDADTSEVDALTIELPRTDISAMQGTLEIHAASDGAIVQSIDLESAQVDALDGELLDIFSWEAGSRIVIPLDEALAAGAYYVTLPEDAFKADNLETPSKAISDENEWSFVVTDANAPAEEPVASYADSIPATYEDMLAPWSNGQNAACPDERLDEELDLTADLGYYMFLPGNGAEVVCGVNEFMLLMPRTDVTGIAGTLKLYKDGRLACTLELDATNSHIERASEDILEQLEWEAGTSVRFIVDDKLAPDSAYSIELSEGAILCKYLTQHPSAAFTRDELNFTTTSYGVVSAEADFPVYQYTDGSITAAVGDKLTVGVVIAAPAASALLDIDGYDEPIVIRESSSLTFTFNEEGLSEYLITFYDADGAELYAISEVVNVK